MQSSQARSAVITSPSNSLAKWLRGLRERRGREASGAFLVEGPRAISQGLEAGVEPLSILYVPEYVDDHPDARQLLSRIPDAVEQRAATDRVLSSVADTVNAQGIVAAFPMQPWRPLQLDVSRALVLVLDEVSDPGNVGTLLRTAAAVGASAVLLSSGSADPYNPKVVRSSAGALFLVPFATLDWSRLRELLRPLKHVYATSMAAETTYFQADLANACAILVGNEARGLSPDAVETATSTIRIPMARGVESLNAAVAGSVILYEALRQRLQSPTGVGYVAGQ